MKKNTFKISSRLRRSKIRIIGKQNIIEIRKGNLKYIKIGINGNNNNITINEGTVIRNLELIIDGNNHFISIGSYTEMGETNIVCCGENTKVIIGSNCLFGSNISLKSCDGHAIYKNDIIINNSKNIIIKNNVWIAQDVNILKGVIINENSIVGINSLVTSNNFQANTIIAGVPAKVINTEVTWTKDRTL